MPEGAAGNHWVKNHAQPGLNKKFVLNNSGDGNGLLISAVTFLQSRRIHVWK